MRALAALVVLWAAPVAAVDCAEVTHLDQAFTICEVDPARDELRLFLRDEDGDILGSFRAVERQTGRPLALGMNAGMYHDDRSPVGHYIEDGREEMRVIETAGPGNFGLLPNGVFCITEASARVIETRAYQAERPGCRHATQSGPMLVRDGALHPRLIPGGTSRYIRNGVGTSARGDRAVFAISEGPVNFHDFATLFRDRLNLPDALYFDGKVSRLHAPQLGRSDFGWALGPIVGVLAPADGAVDVPGGAD
ncbi:MAG: phosphodiester glycosidase family protein [Salibaculum sp.]|jgi:uncharacterized protein YigE (DUF2233 family)|uniref:phosphodiester glycosidase family protein n=1 Tax=Salibaculum sp. TaxID=2855480 RepID=UPI002870B2C8|nr:phosphodiester glycosidase family protein [Salibaculum sp.]MDR9427801.1 phosphodiester glycosidase family protein [Salibaculum sp.]MDR9482002.1 phosphodiester glycosidase family protein [Salibaculum sp.]